MFSIFYFSPLWAIGAAILLNDYFVWYNMLNVFTLYEYCAILALSISFPTATFAIYFGLKNMWEKRRKEEERVERKKRFDFVSSIAKDQEIWASVTKSIQLLSSMPIHCSAYIIEPKRGAYALCIIYTIDEKYKIGFDTIEISNNPSETTDITITKCIEELYYSLYQESGLRNGIYSFKKLINHNK